jgi:hypothetical protein
MSSQKDRRTIKIIFLDDILATLKAGKTRMACGKGGPTLLVQIDNSMCHKSPNVTATIDAAGMLRAFHPSDSLTLSPCDFSAIEMLKQKIMDWHLQSAEEIRGMRQTSGVRPLWMTTRVFLRNG